MVAWLLVCQNGNGVQDCIPENQIGILESYSSWPIREFYSWDAFLNYFYNTRGEEYVAKVFLKEK